MWWRGTQRGAWERRAELRKEVKATEQKGQPGEPCGHEARLGLRVGQEVTLAGKQKPTPTHSENAGAQGYGCVRVGSGLQVRSSAASSTTFQGLGELGTPKLTRCRHTEEPRQKPQCRAGTGRDGVAEKRQEAWEEAPAAPQTKGGQMRGEERAVKASFVLFASGPF